MKNTPHMHPINIKRIACRRGGRLLFSGLDICLAPHSAIGVYGGNGAGKSSLLRGLAGFLPLEHAAIETPISSPISNTDLHYVGHKNALKSTLTIDETLYFYGVFYASVMGADTPDLPQIKAHSGLGGLGTIRVRDLSAGQARRLALARLLCAPRPLWLLDEPFSGLDKQGRDWFEQMINTHLIEGGALIITSHNEHLSFLTKTIEIGAHQ